MNRPKISSRAAQRRRAEKAAETKCNAAEKDAERERSASGEGAERTERRDAAQRRGENTAQG